MNMSTHTHPHTSMHTRTHKHIKHTHMHTVFTLYMHMHIHPAPHTHTHKDNTYKHWQPSHSRSHTHTHTHTHTIRIHRGGQRVEWIEIKLRAPSKSGRANCLRSWPREPGQLWWGGGHAAEVRQFKQSWWVSPESAGRWSREKGAGAAEAFIWDRRGPEEEGSRKGRREGKMEERRRSWQRDDIKGSEGLLGDNVVWGYGITPVKNRSRLFVCVCVCVCVCVYVCLCQCESH